jgi:SAM-dependent methyltransferase
MVDTVFEHPRLIAIYDQLDADRRDLTAYLRIAEALDARRVLDIGCGTGVFALLLAERGIEVTGIDPAGGSLAVARAKPGADRVHWIHGDFRSDFRSDVDDADSRRAHGPKGSGITEIEPGTIDLATMTGNVAQAIADPQTWEATLRRVHGLLRPGGHLVFETRNPAREAWREWNRASSYRTTEIPGVGTVETWTEVIDVSGPLVTFRSTWVFASDAAVLTSDSTLRFREQHEVEAVLRAHGYRIREVRDAPDRPGLEFVFLAQRPD